MASILLKTVELLVLTLLPGGLTLLSARKRRKLTSLRGWSEFLYLSLLSSFSLSSLAGLILAHLGIFSVARLAVLLLLYSLLILIFFRPPFRVTFVKEEGRNWASLILLAIIVLAGILFLRPVEYIFGGWDPGVYAATAVHIARTGSITVEDTLLASLSPEDEEAFAHRHKWGYLEKYPGFRLAGRGTNRLVPQFYHLFPVWLAVCYSWLGLWGMFYFTPVIGLFSLASVYLATRELWGRKAALLGVFLLSINRVQIWQARFPTAEMLSQFFLFGGLYALFRFLKKEERYFGWMAGLALGAFILTRISAALVLLPLAVFFYLRWFLRFHKSDFGFWITLVVLFAASLLPHVIFGPWYAHSVLGSLVLRGIPVRLLLLLVGCLGLGARLLPLRFRERLVALAGQNWFRWAAVGILFILLWYGYFIRPYSGTFNLDKTNLVELGWLLSPVGLLLGSLGLFLLIIRNRRVEVWLFLLVIVAFSGIYLWQQMVHQVYMWAARRYAVAVVPGFLLFAVYLILGLVRSRRGQVFAPVLFALLALQLAGWSRPIWTHREYRGAIDFVENLAGELAGADLLIIGGDFVDKLPALLDLVYGYKVLPVYRDDPFLWRRFSEGIGPRNFNSDARLYFLSSEPPPPVAGVEFEPAGEFPFHSILLERRYEYLPRTVEKDAPDANFMVRVYRMVLLPA